MILSSLSLSSRGFGFGFFKYKRMIFLLTVKGRTTFNPFQEVLHDLNFKVTCTDLPISS